MTLMYFLVNIHINNQSTLYKVNGVDHRLTIQNLPAQMNPESQLAHNQQEIDQECFCTWKMSCWSWGLASRSVSWTLGLWVVWTSMLALPSRQWKSLKHSKPDFDITCLAHLAFYAAHTIHHLLDLPLLAKNFFQVYVEGLPPKKETWCTLFPKRIKNFCPFWLAGVNFKCLFLHKPGSKGLFTLVTKGPGQIIFLVTALGQDPWPRDNFLIPWSLPIV
jgi:hypothetical protein